MARPLRVEFPGACFHVINHGNYRRSLFEDRGAAAAFERTLGEAALRFRWEIHAYVIMRNHFHLGLRLTEPNLSWGMQWLQGTWIRRYNCFRKLVGRPFQGRYKAILVEAGPDFAAVCHYIHLNPVRARILSPDEAMQYRHSSLAHFPKKTRPGWLCAETVLRQTGLPDDPGGWREYAHHLEFLAADPRTQREWTIRKFSRGWCVGSKEFQHQARREWQRDERSLTDERFAGLEPEVLEQERWLAWEERLQRLAMAAAIDLNQLAAKRSDPAKVLLAAAMKQSSSVSNAWLADRLAMGRPASASQFVRRWLLSRAGRAAATELLSRVKA